MSRIQMPTCALIAALTWTSSVSAQLPRAGDPGGDGLWTRIDRQARHAANAPQFAAESQAFTEAAGLFRLNRSELEAILRRAPLETSRAAPRLANAALPEIRPPEIQLPLPDGTLQRFRIEEAPVVSPELAAKYPELRAYRGQGIDDTTASARLDLGTDGLHAQILSSRGTLTIDPTGLPDEHSSQFRRDRGRGPDFQCLVRDLPEAPVPAARAAMRAGPRSGQLLRTYRLAVACTAEYTAARGGSVASALRSIHTTVNRVTGVYEQELAIRLELVANNDLLIATNPATDRLTNDQPGTLLNEIQGVIDSIIPPTDYDVGHVFCTADSGVAILRSVCVNGQKARGVTGRPQPFGDGFDIDYVAHELGHQFGGNHTFNGDSCLPGARNGSTAYEPGSGSTIMAYAGICQNDDLQPNSHSYFHSESLAEILAFVSSAPGHPQPVATGNTPPTVDAGQDFDVPHGTPFLLTAVGSDPDGDPVLYCWEQRDLGPMRDVAAADDGQGPLCRSFPPVAESSRCIVRLADLLGGTAAKGERLPTVSRTMRFRVTARDIRAGSGGIAGDDVEIRVHSNAGPFRVLSPNVSTTVSGPITVTWDVAATNTAPINVSRVAIRLSTDGGHTFPITLAADTPNDGSQNVTLPSETTALARIRIEALGNIFFDISDVDFAIVPSAPPNPPLALVPVDSRKEPNEAVSIEDAQYVSQVNGSPGQVHAARATGNEQPNAISILQQRVDALEAELRTIRDMLEQIRRNSANP